MTCYHPESLPNHKGEGGLRYYHTQCAPYGMLCAETSGPDVSTDASKQERNGLHKEQEGTSADASQSSSGLLVPTIKATYRRLRILDNAPRSVVDDPDVRTDDPKQERSGLYEAQKATSADESHSSSDELVPLLVPGIKATYRTEQRQQQRSLDSIAISTDWNCEVQGSALKPLYSVVGCEKIVSLLDEASPTTDTAEYESQRVEGVKAMLEEDFLNFREQYMLGLDNMVLNGASWDEVYDLVHRKWKNGSLRDEWETFIGKKIREGGMDMHLPAFPEPFWRTVDAQLYARQRQIIRKRQRLL